MLYEKVCNNFNCIFYNELFDMNCSHGYNEGKDECPDSGVKKQETASVKNNIIVAVEITYTHPIGKGISGEWIETKFFKPDQPISDIFQWDLLIRNKSKMMCAEKAAAFKFKAFCGNCKAIIFDYPRPFAFDPRTVHKCWFCGKEQFNEGLIYDFPFDKYQ